MIPANVKQIGGYIVAKCPKLKYVQLLTKDAWLDNRIFMERDENNADVPIKGVEYYAYDGSSVKSDLEAMGLTVKSLKKLENVVIADIPAQTYTGKAIEPAVSVTINGVPAVLGKDYKVVFSNNVNAGMATVKIVGIYAYTGEQTKTFTIAKAANPMKVKAKKVKVKAKKVKKKTQKLAAKKLITVTGAQGKVTYKLGKISCKKKLAKQAKKKIKLAKTGKLTLKKGLKKGTYKFKVKVTVAGNGNYNTASKTVTVKLTVK